MRRLLLAVLLVSAAVGSTSDGVVRGMAGVASRAGNGNAVFVITATDAGTSADLPFHLLVNC